MNYDDKNLADTVFAIARSTFGDDIRYIKHLKSNSVPNISTASGGCGPTANTGIDM